MPRKPKNPPAPSFNPLIRSKIKTDFVGSEYIRHGFLVHFGDFTHTITIPKGYYYLLWCRCSIGRDPRFHPCACGKGHDVDILWHPAIHWHGKPWNPKDKEESYPHWRLKCILEHLGLDTQNIILRNRPYIQRRRKNLKARLDGWKKAMEEK